MIEETSLHSDTTIYYHSKMKNRQSTKYYDVSTEHFSYIFAYFKIT